MVSQFTCCCRNNHDGTALQDLWEQVNQKYRRMKYFEVVSLSNLMAVKETPVWVQDNALICKESPRKCKNE